MSHALFRLPSVLALALVVSWAVGDRAPAQAPEKKEGPPSGPAEQRGRGRGQERGGRGTRGPGGAFRTGDPLQQALANLNVPEQKKEQAETAIRSYHENVRKLDELARAGLLLTLRNTLNEPEFKQFQQALDRPAGPANASGRRGFGNRGLSVEQIVERLLSFDQNKDGKVTKEELPERLQDLIAKGDRNKDGALDKDEIQQLAGELARTGSLDGFSGRRGPGPGFGGGPRGRGRPGPALSEIVAERALRDLKLTDKKKETAEAALGAYQDDLRKLTALARADLLLKMKDVLRDEDYHRFQVVLERPSRFGPRGNPRTAIAPPPATPSERARTEELEKRLEQLQKGLDELRREIHR